MLDDAYLHWLDQCGFSDPARALLTNIRHSPPVRRVAGGRGKIHGRYPSRKMGMTIQFESHTELGAIYVMEHDPSVLEFYDQPTKLKLHYLGPSGRRVTNRAGSLREQLHSLLQMETATTPAPVNAREAIPARIQRESRRPGTRKPKRETIGE